MKYAINLCDLLTFEWPHPAQILFPPLMTTETVECEPRQVAGTSAILTGDLERIEAAIKIIRDPVGEFKPIPKYRLRIYRSETGKGGWKRV